MERESDKGGTAREQPRAPRTCTEILADAGRRQRDSSKKGWRSGGILPSSETTATAPENAVSPALTADAFLPIRLLHRNYSAGEITQTGNFGAPLCQGLQTPGR